MPRKRADYEEPVEPDEVEEVEAISEPEPESAPAPEPERVPVQILGQMGQAAIVQWQAGDDLHKSTVPSTEVVAGTVRADVLAAGEEPFRWETAGLRPLSVEEQARALRRARIFDPTDYATSPAQAMSAIQRLVVQELNRIAKERRNG